MAESLVDNLPTRYFCHKCNQEINPLPEFKCPGCREGFIEELTNDANLDTSSDDSEHYDNNDRYDDVRTGEILRVLQLFTEGQPSPRGSRGRGMFEMAIPYLQILHGNPGDYAWGTSGLDTIITQLLNTIENNGPPPMPEDEIKKLPTIKICQDDVDKNLQCTVCMDDYKLDEPVRMLPCNHVYHNDCIVPWLEMHGTCPICRKLLNENQPSQRNCESRSSLSNSNQQTSQQQQPVNQRSSSSSNSNSTNHTAGYRDLLDYD
ncbi:E3 ubiquitin-protein ligase RNF126-like [Panonychus citri]|uniref:E3 ubiquitin-protein ligase RNF126-like n=1 Tax=Panonychus citri TaxID=50023 RepID=UPI0023077D30|nr:E3 ubiquitin-protein ligase RNF126-like [Panonychus citri]XP_053203434.1 E3 ubiquitin-protein ligase RNF126-like [Panonychus citri]XP_053214843.1 E3 ubiquitin-protein ligase RNF126-like [Panonychus citri]XP_053214844.1 E3 ubiquitin-protein ligase RNF126-like [Panonychus citri]